MQVLQIFGYWLHQLAIYAAMGIILITLFGLITRRQAGSASRLGFFSVVVTGIAGISALLQIISLFLPINPRAHATILVTIAITTVAVPPIRRKWLDIFGDARQFFLNVTFRSGLLYLFILLGVTTLVLIYAAAPITPYDTGLYHAQTVELAKTFPAIPGIGNLHDRLAFNNSWLLNVAFFSLGPLESKPFLYQNSFLYIAFYLYLAHSVLSMRSVKFDYAAFLKYSYFLISAFFFLKYPLFTSSVSPDVAAYIFTFFIISELIFQPDETISRHLPLFLFLLWSCVTIKFSCIFTAIAFLPHLIRTRRIVFSSFSYVAAMALISFLVLFPFLYRNYLLSGYLVYPLHFMDFFNPDWKISKNTASIQLDAVKGWARYPVTPDFLQATKQSLLEWVPRWYSLYKEDAIIKLAKLNLVLLIPAIVSALRNFKRERILWMFMCLTAINGIWFLSAPDPRFAYGSLLAACALTAGAALSFSVPWLDRHASKFLSAVPAAILVLSLMLILFSKKQMATEYLLSRAGGEQSYPAPKMIERLNIQGKPIVSPADQGEQCWNWALNCTPYYDRNLLYRGSLIQNGFRMSKMPPT